MPDHTYRADIHRCGSLTSFLVLLGLLMVALGSTDAANGDIVDQKPMQPSRAISSSRRSLDTRRNHIHFQGPSGLGPEVRPRSAKDLVLSSVVLVSSVEGGIYGLDRSTGQVKWTLPPRIKRDSDRGSEKDVNDSMKEQINKNIFDEAVPAGFGPLLGTSYGPDQRSFEELANNVPLIEKRNRGAQSDGITSGHEALEALQKLGLYVVEPSAGQMYILSTSADAQGPARTSLSKLPLTIAQLVELSPFSFPGDNSRVFVGEKRTSLVELDLRSGKIGAVFGGNHERVMWCDSPMSKGPGGAECNHEASSTEEWTYIGRTDYNLTIHLRGRPSLSQTLRFSTFSPNTADRDIAALWTRIGFSADNKALMGMPGEGTVVCFDAKATKGKRRDNDNTLWISEVGATVAGIFDIVYPAPHLGLDAAKPIIVPHPTQPLRSLFPSAPVSTILPSGESGHRNLAEGHEHSTLLGIADGHLYAMGGEQYPLVSFSPRAPAGQVVNQDVNHGTSDCTSFGCLLGTYDTHSGEETVSGSEGLLGFEVGHAPLLGIGDGQDHSDDAKEAGQTGQVLDSPPAHTIPPGIEAPRVASSIWSWNPSPMMAMTQIIALLLLAVLCGLIYVGAQELQRQRSEEAKVIAKEIIWTPRAEKEEVHANGEAAMESKYASTSEVKEVPKRDPEEVARELLAEEAAASVLAERLEKKKPAKRRKRGKRAGQAVQQKEAKRDTSVNNDEESGMEEDGDEDLPLLSEANGMSRSTTQDTFDASGWIDVQANADEQAIKLAAKESMSAEGGVQLPSTDGAIVSRGNQSLLISDEVLGYGSSGTIVFKGTFQGRAVAVKRLLRDFVDVASKEVSLLESADNHANVIRYFYKEVTSTFLFIALELCPASLADIIEKPQEYRELSAQLDPKKALFQITSGLRHLHSLSIVHRDIKPQNILVSSQNGGKLKMMLSDFGLSKRLDGAAQTSFSQTMNNPGGTVGWRAPEILRGDVSLDLLADGSSSSANTTINSTSTTKEGSNSSDPVERKRLTRAVDIFALGCLTYYVLSNGDHPFGSRYEREMNIIRKQVDLQRLDGLGEESHEAQHLILSMIQHDPKDRPDATKVISHPYFWSPSRRLTFLQDASDRMDIMERDPPAPALLAMEENAISVVGLDWHKRIDKQFMEDIGKRRKYDGKSVVDLLRAIRNKKHHIHDLSPNLKRLFGGQTDGFLAYFTSRFPTLFLHTYEVIDSFTVLKSEATFAPYFAPTDV